MNIIFLLLFSIVPQNDVVIDGFDKVEINHFYDDNGRHIFDQVLWSDYIANYHRIEAWRLVKNPGTIPTFNLQSNQYESLFYDNDTLRCVKAKSMVESWTQYDPELVGRETWPKEKRRDLSLKPVPPKLPDITPLLRILLP